jgi:hypothetical protein
MTNQAALPVTARISRSFQTPRNLPLSVLIARYGDDMFFGININARRIRIDAHLRPSGVLGSTSGARCLGLSPSRKEQ